MNAKKIETSFPSSSRRALIFLLLFPLFTIGSSLIGLKLLSTLRWSFKSSRLFVNPPLWFHVPNWNARFCWFGDYFFPMAFKTWLVETPWEEQADPKLVHRDLIGLAHGSLKSWHCKHRDLRFPPLISMLGKAFWSCFQRMFEADGNENDLSKAVLWQFQQAMPVPTTPED